MLIAALVSSLQRANSASLDLATVGAWNHYLDVQNARMQERATRGHTFLWTFDDERRAARVHRGEIVVGRVAKQDPMQVTGGMIHHWAGAVFLPNAKLSDVAEITRDYARYKEFYRPTVIESKLLARGSSGDKFTMVLMNKAAFLEAAVEADYDVKTVIVDDHRIYRVSRTTRVQEIKDYGTEQEALVPEGEGSGYIWKLYSVARFEERDNGVYTEVEFIALSRDVPVAVRFIADPIIRNVSKSSLLVSLQQTEQAVRGVLASNGSVDVIPRRQRESDVAVQGHATSAFAAGH